MYAIEAPPNRRVSRADRARAVTVHLPGGCRRKRQTVQSTDPLAITCRVCLSSRTWRRIARRAVNELNLT